MPHITIKNRTGEIDGIAQEIPCGTAVKLVTGTNKIARAEANTDIIAGILAENVKADEAGQCVEYFSHGSDADAIAGAAIVRGDELEVNANGHLIPATGDYKPFVAMTDAPDVGQKVQVHIRG